MSDFLKKALVLAKGKEFKSNVIVAKSEGVKFTANNMVTCPKCGRRLIDVELYSGTGKYCPSDRITIPNMV